MIYLLSLREAGMRLKVECDLDESSFEQWLTDCALCLHSSTSPVAGWSVAADSSEVDFTLPRQSRSLVLWINELLLGPSITSDAYWVDHDDDLDQVPAVGAGEDIGDNLCARLAELDEVEAECNANKLEQLVDAIF